MQAANIEFLNFCPSTAEVCFQQLDWRHVSESSQNLLTRPWPSQGGAVDAWLALRTGLGAFSSPCTPLTLRQPRKLFVKQNLSRREVQFWIHRSGVEFQSGICCQQKPWFFHRRNFRIACSLAVKIRNSQRACHANNVRGEWRRLRAWQYQVSKNWMWIKVKSHEYDISK